MLQHGTAVLVAIAFATIAFADGGYSTELIAAGAIAIWWIVIVGILARWWRGGEGVPREAVLAGTLLAALGAWTALSLLWATDAGRAFAEVVRVAAYLGAFVLAVMVARSAGPRPLLNGLTLGLLAVGVASLATRLFLGVFATDDLETFAVLNSATGRLGFPIGYWNGLAACMAGLIVLLAWLSGSAATVARRSLAAAAILAPALVIYFSSSRGGYAAAAAGALIVIALGPRRRSRVIAGVVLSGIGAAALIWLASRNSDLINGFNTDSAQAAGWQIAVALIAFGALVGGVKAGLEPRLDQLRIARPRPRVIAAVAVVGVVALAVFVNPIERVEEFRATPDEVARSGAQGTGDLLRGSGSGRYQFWDVGLDAFRSDPLTGIGAGNYELWWNVNGTLPRKVVDAHSVFIETLAELGLVGFLLLAGFVATLAVALYRALRAGISAEAAAAAGLVGAGLLSAALDWTWEIPAVFGLVLAGAAILTAAPREAVRAVGSAEPPGPSEAVSRDGFGLGVAVFATAWASIWAAGVLLLTEVKLDDSREAAARGDLEAAVQSAVDAGAVQPWSPEPPLQEAQVELLQGDIPRARAAAAEAVRLAPDDWRTWLVAARVESEAEQDAAYDSAIARAIELAPLPLPVEQGGAP